MTKIETIELYGVITKITAISAHDVIVDVKEEGTGNEVGSPEVSGVWRVHLPLQYVLSLLRMCRLSAGCDVRED